MEKEINGEMLNVPEHVAIILDGNGRWARKRMLARSFGHAEGARNVERICEDADSLGIKYLTVYAFSTENWKRSVEEVSAIMKLLRKYLSDSIERANKNDMRIRVIGERGRLDADIREKINELEEATKNNTGLNFTIALNYGSRDEITRAFRKLAGEINAGRLSIDDITEDSISACLDTAGIPDPDLLIRTSGEIRTSNFLQWQIAYSEFYFTEVLWPDFDKAELIKAVKYYSGRDRRYGGVK
jgi:undecaprenyl diphosphate synthase